MDFEIHKINMIQKVLGLTRCSYVTLRAMFDIVIQPHEQL